MSTPAECIEAFHSWRSTRQPLRSTSFSGIDRATSGFVSGRVWVVTGTPGQGRSTLAVQWARYLAVQHGLRTDLVSVKEPAHLVTARLLASAGRIPVADLWTGATSDHDEPKLRRAHDVLTQAPMRIFGPDQMSVLTTDPPSIEMPEALVIDDADLAAGALPERLRGFADSDMLVLVTLPKHQVVGTDGINPDWARVADHIVEVDRPDARDADSLRPGEADLRLLRNRWGPQLTESVAFQGHYARFVGSSV